MTSQPTVQDLYEEGWSLIPVGWTKKPRVFWKEFQGRRATLDEIAVWEREHQPPIWAGVTGQVSGRVSLDFDGEEGRATLLTFDLEPHRQSPSGGFHLDVKAPPWKVATLNRKSKPELGKRFPGLDIRGDGGYINLLGSTPDGTYRTQRHERLPYEIGQLPIEVADYLDLLSPPRRTPCASRTQARPVRATVDDEGDSLYRADADVPQRLLTMAVRRAQKGGHRNDNGYWLAQQLRDHRLSWNEALLVMRSYVDRVADLPDAKGLGESYTEEEALASLAQAYKGEPRESWLLPTIEIGNRQLREIADQAARQLVDFNDPPRLFRRAGMSVRLMTSQEEGLKAEPIALDAMVHELSRSGDWVRREGEEVRAVFPNPAVARDLLVRNLDLPVLRGVVEAPCLRPDGHLLSTPGYDSASGLYLHLDPDMRFPRVQDEPSDGDIEQAASLIVNELLGEFPFQDQASRANAVALFLTPILRSAFDGLVPLALVDAPVAGSGKTLLTEVVGLVALGRKPGLTVGDVASDEELRKRLTTLFVAGEPLIVLDNVAGAIRSPVLAQALTGEKWTDRLLGVSRQVTVEQRAVWAATGNNISVGGDIARRCYPIRLDPQLAQPWRREFNRPDLTAWAADNRGNLLAAALTIGRAWFARGCPSGSVRPWGSFQSWSNLMSGVLDLAGVPRFLTNLDQFHEDSDTEAAGWVALLDFWHSEFSEEPVKVKRMAASLTAYELQNELPPSLSESRNGASSEGSRISRLSRKLNARKGQRLDDSGLRLEHAGKDTHSKTMLWRVVRDSPQDTQCEVEPR